MDQKKEQEVMIKVLGLYKNYRHLWDTKSINYRNKLMRQDSLNKLLEIYKEFDSAATTDTLKSKLNNMKKNYLQDADKVKRNSQYVPRVWYYDYMKFLTEPSESGQRSSETSNKIEKEGIMENESEVSGDTMPAPLKKVQEIIEEGQEAVTEVDKSLLTRKYNKLELLAKLYATDLQHFDDEQLSIVIKLISDVLYYGKHRKLTVNSSINLGQK